MVSAIGGMRGGRSSIIYSALGREFISYRGTILPSEEEMQVALCFRELPPGFLVGKTPTSPLYNPYLTPIYPIIPI